MGFRRTVTAIIVAWGASVVAPAVATAATATTLQATSVTATSAVLTGTVDTSDADTAYGFLYGTSVAYDHGTGLHPVSTGFSFVSATLTGLKPSTTYHYALVVLSGSYQPTTTYGSDVSFKTSSQGSSGGSGGGGPGSGAKYASTSLRSKRLKVKHGIASVRFACSGPSGTTCQANIALRTRTKAGRTVGCGKGKLSTTAGHNRTVRVRIGRRCRALLTAAPHGRLRAILKAKFSSNQAPFKIAVKLIQA